MEPIVLRSSNGPVEIAFGVNRWVLVTTTYDSLQGRAADEEALAGLLYDAGVPRSETAGVAAEAWRRRPKEAGMSTAHAGESMLRGTGLSRRGAIVLVAAIALAMILLTYLVSVDH